MPHFIAIDDRREYWRNKYQWMHFQAEISIESYRYETKAINEIILITWVIEFSKNSHNSITHSIFYFYSVTLTFLPLRGNVYIPSPWIWMWLCIEQKWGYMTSESMPQNDRISDWFSWILAFGTQSLHCQEP